MIRYPDLGSSNSECSSDEDKPISEMIELFDQVQSSDSPSSARPDEVGKTQDSNVDLQAASKLDGENASNLNTKESVAKGVQEKGYSNHLAPSPAPSLTQKPKYRTFTDVHDKGAGTIFVYKFVPGIPHERIALRKSPFIESDRIRHITVKRESIFYVDKRLSSSDGNIYLRLLEGGWLFCFDYHDGTKIALQDKRLCYCVKSEKKDVTKDFKLSKEVHLDGQTSSNLNKKKLEGLLSSSSAIRVSKNQDPGSNTTTTSKRKIGLKQKDSSNTSIGSHIKTGLNVRAYPQKNIGIAPFPKTHITNVSKYGMDSKSLTGTNSSPGSSITVRSNVGAEPIKDPSSTSSPTSGVANTLTTTCRSNLKARLNNVIESKIVANSDRPIPIKSANVAEPINVTLSNTTFNVKSKDGASFCITKSSKKSAVSNNANKSIPVVPSKSKFKLNGKSLSGSLLSKKTKTPNIMYYSAIPREPILIKSGQYEDQKAELIGKGRGWFYAQLLNQTFTDPNKSEIVPLRTNSFIRLGNLEQKGGDTNVVARTINTQYGFFTSLDTKGGAGNGADNLNQIIENRNSDPKNTEGRNSISQNDETVDIIESSLTNQNLNVSDGKNQDASPIQLRTGASIPSNSDTHTAHSTGEETPYNGNINFVPENRRSLGSLGRRSKRIPKHVTNTSISGKDIKPDKLREGACLQIYSADTKAYKSGRLKRHLGSSRWLIEFDDGSTSNLRMEDERYKVLANFNTCSSICRRGSRCMLPPLRGMPRCIHHATTAEKEKYLKQQQHQSLQQQQSQNRNSEGPALKPSRPTRSEPAPKCAAILSGGKRCGKYPLRGQTYCGAHISPSLYRSRILTPKRMQRVKRRGSSLLSGHNATRILDEFTHNMNMINAAVQNQKQNIISLRGAKGIFEALKEDASYPGEYTEISRKSMLYIRQRFKMSPEAEKWLKHEVVSWLKMKSGRTSGTSLRKRALPLDDSDLLGSDGDSSGSFEAPGTPDSTSSVDSSTGSSSKTSEMLVALLPFRDYLQDPTSALFWLKENLTLNTRVFQVPTCCRNPLSRVGFNGYGYEHHFAILGLEPRSTTKRLTHVFVPSERFSRSKAIWILKELSKGNSSDNGNIISMSDSNSIVQGSSSYSRTGSKRRKRSVQIVNNQDRYDEWYAEAENLFNLMLTDWRVDPDVTTRINVDLTEGSEDYSFDIQPNDIEKWLNDVGDLDERILRKLKAGLTELRPK